MPWPVRERFVSEVQEINWAYKLAASTINLPATDAVPEIQIFQILAKGEDVSEPVLAAIDKSIPFPIIFEISRSRDGDPDGTVRMVAAQKQIGTGSPRTSAYYSTVWLSSDAQRQPFFTMDLLQDPRTILEAGLGQPPNAQVALLIQVLQALAYLHRRGVLHRDLKPANVLVTGHDQVRLLDFGLADAEMRYAATLGQGRFQGSGGALDCRVVKYPVAVVARQSNLIEQHLSRQVADRRIVLMHCGQHDAIARRAGGGGQPIPTSPAIREARARAIYQMSPACCALAIPFFQLKAIRRVGCLVRITTQDNDLMSIRQ